MIPANTEFDIGSDLFPLLAEKGLPFFAQGRPFEWIDIGSITDFWTVLQDVMQGGVETLKLPGKQVADGVWVGLNARIDWEGTTIEGPVYIGSGTHVEAGCHIVGPTWIGHGSHIVSGAEVVRSMIFEYTRIGHDVQLEDMIVFKDYCISRDGESRHIKDCTDTIWGNARDRRLARRA
jgi:mannose-1-phosphate guanylyltransferase